MTKKSLPKLSSNFTITVGEEEKTIKMSFGLLNELSRRIGDIELVAEVAVNAELRDELLVEVFSERDETGKISKPVNLFLLDVDPEDMINLLDWVGSHVTDFLLSTLMKTKEMMEARKTTFEALMPTSNGGVG